MPTYRLLIHRRAQKGLAALPKGLQGKVRGFIQEQVEVNPSQRIPGKTKKLKGRLRGVLQHSQARAYRMHYRVDEETKTVFADYIGPHP